MDVTFFWTTCRFLSVCLLLKDHWSQLFCICRMAPWTTTSSCCRSTRCPTWSVPPTSSTRQRSSLKVVRSSSHLQHNCNVTISVDCRGDSLGAEFHRRISSHTGDSWEMAVSCQQRVPVWPWHVYWCPLCHWSGQSSGSSRYSTHWARHEIWGTVEHNIQSDSNLTKQTFAGCSRDDQEEKKGSN